MGSGPVPLRHPAAGHLDARAAVRLGLFAAGPSVAALLVGVAINPAGLFNDFHSYWYAGRLLAEGTSPYDLEALRTLAARNGDAFTLGTGFSYPLPFAIAMVPLSALPFKAAVVLFDAISVAAFATIVVAWLGRFHPTAAAERLGVAALAAGSFPPVVGSVLNGQANLLVTAALAVGAALVLERSALRSAIGGIAIGVAAVVKVVPAVLIVPLCLSRLRRGAAASAIAGFVVLFGLAAAIRPGVALDSGKLAILLGSDPFVTNQSINGFVSRIVDGSDRLAAALPGAFDPGPVVIVLTAGFAIATLAILIRAARRLATLDGLALGLALSLAAATAGAPKTSFWNLALVLVAVGLLLAATAPTLEFRAFTRGERRLLVTWWAVTLLQPLVWVVPRMPPGPAAALLVALGSLSLYGSLALWWLLGRRLLVDPGADRAPGLTR